MPAPVGGSQIVLLLLGPVSLGCGRIATSPEVPVGCIAWQIRPHAGAAGTAEGRGAGDGTGIVLPAFAIEIKKVDKVKTVKNINFMTSLQRTTSRIVAKDYDRNVKRVNFKCYIFDQRPVSV